MKMPLQWAQTYADFSCTDQEFADKMTMTGSKVETYTRESDSMKNVVIGRIASLEKHPDSDHLWICQVDIGTDTIQIVTGAQNLKQGDLCPAALHGSKLPNGMQIKRGKLRGVESNGMLCSLDELGLTVNDFPGAAQDGILVLQDSPAQPGDDAAAALGMDDVVFEFEITPNRPDCLSVRALAREAAATFGVPFKDTAPVVKPGTGKVEDLLEVEVNCPELCSRYTAAVVDNVRIQPSPQWMRQRLRQCGVRPINNIVDITNYVMLEYGQPMHAFDYSYVNGQRIIIGLAQEGQEIVTLDGETRKLSPDMLIISDKQGPVAVAGVMGGEYSGVYETTTRVVFEVACFDGASVRATAKRLGMRTESSGRFEKGLNPENVLPAMMRALELVQELDAGDVVQGILDSYPRPRMPRRVGLNQQGINRLLGISLTLEQMAEILRPLGFEVEGEEVIVPPSRYDIKIYNDIAEEIARYVGYNKIPSTVMKGVACARPTSWQVFREKMCSLVAGYGFWECETFSFYSGKNFDKIRLPQDSPLRNAVAIQNPLGEETSLMRTTALPSILEVAGRNWASRNETAALFELATEYIPAQNSDELPEEIPKVMLAAYGQSWDYFAMKGVVESLAASARITGITVRRNSEGTSFHPGRCADFYADMQQQNSKPTLVKFATVGEIHPEVCAEYGIKPRVVAADINLALLFALQGGPPQFTPLPKFPPTTRDLALVAKADLPASEIAGRIQKAGGKLLEKLTLFDVYTGDRLGEDKKSLAYSLVLRGQEGTLTDQDADKVVAKILKSLEEIGVELRS